jgi:uncharacterized membrane protein
MNSGNKIERNQNFSAKDFRKSFPAIPEFWRYNSIVMDFRNTGFEGGAR